MLVRHDIIWLNYEGQAHTSKFAGHRRKMLLQWSVPARAF